MNFDELVAKFPVINMFQPDKLEKVMQNTPGLSICIDKINYGGIRLEKKLAPIDKLDSRFYYISLETKKYMVKHYKFGQLCEECVDHHKLKSLLPGIDLEEITEDGYYHILSYTNGQFAEHGRNKEGQLFEKTDVAIKACASKFYVE